VSKYHIIRSEDYDWIALYKDGVCLDQGHSIQEEDMLKLLGLEYTHQVEGEAQFNEWGGWAPERLDT